MDALSDVLQPYKETVGSLAGILTIGHMFSGSFICYDIYKQGSTKGIGITPFVGGLAMGLLNLQFGYILRDDTMIKVNFYGLALNIIYLMIYFHYAEDKVQVWAKIGVGCAFSAIMIAYAQYEDPALVGNRFGTILTGFMFYMLASPLFGLKDIIKNKSTEGMPFPIIMSGTVILIMWLLYGIILKNQFLVIQNAVGLVLCLVQLALFVIYPSKPKKEKKAKAKKAD